MASCCFNWKYAAGLVSPLGAGVTARFSLCEDGGAEDSEEREPEEEEGH